MSWKASLAAVQAGESPAKAKPPKPPKSKQGKESSYEEDPEEQYDDEEDIEQQGRAYAATEHGYGGAASWAGVDEAELEESSMDLFDSVTRSMHGTIKGSLLEQLFSADNGVEVKEVLDPLGLGALDLHSSRIVKEGTTKHASKRGKGQRGKSKGGRQSGGGQSDAGAATAASVVLPTQPDFAPEAYLGSFHQDTPLPSLRKGLKTLDRELHERKGQLKQLIRENFARFTSCQQTIDDIYAKLQQADGMVVGAASKAKPKSAGATSPRPVQVGGLEGLQRSLAGVALSARDTWGDVLDRAHKAERIKSVAGLLARFNNLFGMPARIKVLAGEGSWSQIVAEYKRANALISPSANTGSRVWMALYQEIVKRVLEAQSGCKSQLLAAKLDAETSPQTIIFLAQLSHERLPGSVGEDAMRMTLEAAQSHIDAAMTECDAQLANRLATFKRQLHRNPAALTAALDFAAAWKLQGATAWQLEGGAPGPSADVPASPTLGHVAKSKRNRKHGSRSHSADQHAEQGGSSSRRVTSRMGHSERSETQHHHRTADGEETDSDGSVSTEDEEEEGDEEGGRASGPPVPAPAAAGGGEGPGGGARHSPNPGMPAAPSSLDDLALLMWPGTTDWQPHLDLAPAVRLDLQWRLLPTTPRSQLLPEPSFRLSPAQSAWAEFVAELNQVLVARLPALWAVATSQQYAQVTDVPPAVLESMRKAPSLARRMIEGVMVRYQGRLQVALQALSQAGPLCPAVELMVKELCRTYHALHESGVSSKAHECVRDGALAALSLYGSCLYAHMASVPLMLLSNESWSLDTGFMDHQPVTSLPRLMQEELCLVLFHFGVLSSLSRSVDARGTAEAWGHLRRGLLACVTSLTESVSQQAASVKKRVQAALKRQESMRQLADRSRAEEAAQKLLLAPLGSGQLDDLHLATSLQELLLMEPVSAPPTSASARNLNAFDSSPGHPLLKEEGSLARSSAQSAVQGVQGQAKPTLVRNMTETGMMGSRADAGVLQRGGQAGAGVLSACEEARVLILASNADRVRSHVVPAVMQQYSQQLTGGAGAKRPREYGMDPEGDDDDNDGHQHLVDDAAASQFPSQLQGKLRELKAATAQLLDWWREHRTCLGCVQVKAYLRVVLTDGWVGDESQGGHGGLGLPCAVSDACMALVASLVEGCTLAALYCPHMPLGSVMSHLVLHVIRELSAGRDVMSDLASPYGLLQLMADIMYLKHIWQALLDESGQQELASLMSHISDLLSHGLSDLRRAGLGAGQVCAAMQALMAAAGGKRWGRELRGWATPLVEACLEHTQSNVSCFADAAEAFEGEAVS